MGKPKRQKASQPKEHMRPGYHPVVVDVDNPNFSRDHAEGKDGNVRLIKATRNVMESPAAFLFSKGAIDECQLAAADQFRRLFEAMGGCGPRAIDWRREAVDGGKIPDPISTHALEAGRSMKAAHAALKQRHGDYAWMLLEYVCGEGRHPHDLTATRRQNQTMIDNIRMYLDCLSQHWGLATRRRAS